MSKRRQFLMSVPLLGLAWAGSRRAWATGGSEQPASAPAAPTNGVAGPATDMPAAARSTPEVPNHPASKLTV
jgi:hypothetical protein